LVLATSLLVSLPAASSAQPPPAAQPSAADLESARELFKEGRELRQAGDLPHALERFKAAHAYGQTPVTALELGRTHIQLGELVEGREVLLSVARMKVQSDETDKSAAARAEAADLAEEVKKRISTVMVKVAGTPPEASAQVTVDGSVVPVVGLVGIRKTNPGKHVVIVRAGAREETRTVEVEEGKTQEVTFDLASTTAEPVRPPSPTGGSGTRSISPVTWIGLGLGVAGIGVGAVGGIIALGKASDVNAACDGMHCPPATKDTVDSGRSAATISTIGFAVGGAGLIAAAVGYFILSKPRASGAYAAPFVTAGSVGIDGRF
jgi:hypothetical protein